MIDMDHYIGNDLSVGPTGDIAFVNNMVSSELGEQRILRRLLTNPGDYLWHLAYGGGLARMIGTIVSAATISGIIRGQLSKETAVSLSPAPAINVYSNNNGLVSATIQYADAITGETTVLTVPAVG